MHSGDTDLIISHLSFTSGARLGPYEIVSALGAGGMGEVYRANDTRLNRPVALKAMHALLASDPERVSRFTREAQLLASLNHPNIAAIHGLEEVAGEKYLVLEFVDGRPLSDVLNNGALPTEDAIAYARQIADALASAHERGIIHRDIKPGNVMVTQEGVIKVLDFGLGKSLESDAPASPTNSPTMTLAATQQGLILGTAAYMSPEQAKGRAADKRSDVWSFGCLLFEMLTGTRAFDGEDVTETLAAIVRGEPDWKALPANLAPSIRTLLEQSLVKNRNDRLSDMSVVRYILNAPAGVRATPVERAAAPVSRGRSVGWRVAAAMVVVAMLGTAGVMLTWPPSAPTVASGVTRLSIALPDTDQLTFVNQAPVAISPDGSTIVYSARRAGVFQLFARSLSDAEPRALAGTDGAKSPFFSPDGNWVGFFAQGKLKKIAVSGGGLLEIADAPEARGGTWAADEAIYFAPTNTAGLRRVSATGGAVSAVTTPDAAKGEISHVWPQVQSDRTTIVYTVRNGPGPDEHVIVAQPLGGERTTLVPGGDMGRSVPTGHLVYARLDKLFALPWTPTRRDVTAVVPLALPELVRIENEAAAAYAVSDTGTLVYVHGGPDRKKNRILRVDRNGKAEALPLADKEYESVEISPDGRRMLLQVLEGTVTLWMFDFERQATTPFLVSGGSSQAPAWTPDGRRIIYRATRAGFRNLYWKAADGTGVEERLTNEAGVLHTPTSVSPDGKWVLYYSGGGSTSVLYALPLDTPAGAERVPQLLLPKGESGTGPQFSPDGKWFAYVAGDSGRNEIYVRPFPGPGPRVQVSTTGGDEPRWSHDGREVFFSGLNQEIMGATITLGSTVTAGLPRLLHAGRYKDQVNGNSAYDVTRDGHFLMVQLAETQNQLNRIDVVLNWFSQLRGSAAQK